VHREANMRVGGRVCCGFMRAQRGLACCQHSRNHWCRVLWCSPLPGTLDRPSVSESIHICYVVRNAWLGHDNAGTGSIS
jgi:hypothetical protein